MISKRKADDSVKLIYEDLCRLNNCKKTERIMTGGLGLTDHFMKLLSYLLGEIKYIPDYKQNTAVGAAMIGIKSNQMLR